MDLDLSIKTARVSTVNGGAAVAEGGGGGVMKSGVVAMLVGLVFQILLLLWVEIILFYFTRLRMQDHPQ